MKQLKLFLMTALLSMVVGQAWGATYKAVTSDQNQGLVAVTNSSTAPSATSTNWKTESSSTRNKYFHAQAKSGYEFVGWSTTKNGTTFESTNNPYQYTRDRDKTLYAVFKQKTQPQPGEDGFYLQNMGNSKYLQMVKKATDTASSNNNDGQLGFVSSADENTTSWTFTKFNNSFVKFADSNNDNIVYFGNQGDNNYSYKLTGMAKYNKSGNPEAKADKQSAGEGSKYNCYLYKITNYSSKGTSFTATLTTTAEAGGYYFIASANVQSGSGMMLMGNTLSSQTQITISGTRISATPGASNITVNVSNIKNYIYKFEAAGSTPEPQTKTLYGKLTVSGSNGKIFAAATSGAASGNATVEVNDEVAASATSTKKTVYLYATANTGYEFLGWSTSTSESNIISGSNVAEYAYEFTFNGTSQGGATSKTLYAVFKQKTQPQPGEDGEYYISNLGNGKYLNGTPSATQNAAKLSFSSTKQVWNIESLNSSTTDLIRITTTKDNVTSNLYQGQYTSGNYYFKLYNKETDNSEKYNVYLYEIKAEDINKTEITATRVTVPTAGNYYFIGSKNNASGSTVNIMGNATQSTNFISKSNVGSESSKKITVNVSSIKNYIYKFEVAGSTPEPQTKTLYGKLTVSGSNGKIYAAATSGAASGNATVEVNNEVATSATSAKKTVYLYATANTGYEFLGWSTDNSESNIISGSNVAEYAYEFTFNGTSQGGATSKTLYAIFKEKAQPQPSGTDFYIKNYGLGTYLNGKKAGLSLGNNAQVWSINKLNSSNLFRVLTTDEDRKDRNLCGYYANVFRTTTDHTSASEEYYNCYFYKIEDINAETLTATLVSEVTTSGYYFIYSVYNNSRVSDTKYYNILGYAAGTSIDGDGTTISTYSVQARDNKITIKTSDLSDYEKYIYTLESKTTEYVTVHVGSTGYATYCSSKSLEVPTTSGVEVYGAKLNAEKSAANLSNAVTPGSVIKARTGFIVKATPNTDVKFACKSEVGSTIANNDLIGVTAAKKFTTADVVYLLANDGNDNAVFKRNKLGSSAENTLSANKAYFINPVPKAKYINDILDIEEGDATGINGLNGNDNTDALYNINGVRVNNSYNGVIIKNGKKFLQIR